ncbi:hypothetical protein Q31b_54380 [Novipirellula aureliae]|uniref:Uncharacterized protein n=1 Tax=Novipirellula aureliae TaxID=2527966 RepID=A0A5C6DF86_9BACT|nr:hypothetical protein Q31b_54380 [Novipirellula aureliae]
MSPHVKAYSCCGTSYVAVQRVVTSAPPQPFETESIEFTWNNEPSIDLILSSCTSFEVDGIPVRLRVACRKINRDLDGVSEFTSASIVYHLFRCSRFSS